jgi:hypothetical protein
MEQMDLIDWLDGKRVIRQQPPTQIHTAPPFHHRAIKAHHARTGSLGAISPYHFRSNGTLSKSLPRKSTASDFKSV